MSNNLPRMNYGGIKQKLTATTPSNDVKNVSSHVGLSFVMASKGTEKVLTLNADEVLATYGIDLFDVGAKHYTHQSKYLSRMVAHAGKSVIKRITLPDASVATICLAIEIIVRDNPNYIRNADGSLRYNEDGSVMTDGTVNGIFISWLTIPYSGLGMAAPTQGRSANTIGLDGSRLSNIGSNGEGEGDGEVSSTILPILDIELAWKGTRGNNYAIALAAKSDLLDSKLSTFRPAFLTLLENNNVIPSNNGDPSALFSFDLNHVDEYGSDVDIGAVITKQFRDIGNIHVYSDNLNMVRGAILNGQPGQYDGELASSNTDLIYPDGDVRNAAMLDLLTGTTVKNIPYYSVLVDNGNFGGIDMRDPTPIKFVDGSDGYPQRDDGTWDKLATLRAYDEAVRAEFDSMRYTANPYSNVARYPFRVWWDSGYSMATKIAAMQIKATRPEVNVILTPYSVADVVSSIADPIPDPGEGGACVPDTLVIGSDPSFSLSMGHSAGIRYQINGGPILQTWLQWNQNQTLPADYARAIFMYTLLGVLPTSNSSNVTPSPISDMLVGGINALTTYDFVADIVGDQQTGLVTAASIRGLAASAGVANSTTIKFLPSPGASVGLDYGFDLDLFPIAFGNAASATVHSCGRVQPAQAAPISCSGAINEVMFNIKNISRTYDFIVNGTALYTNVSFAQLVASLRMNNSDLFDVETFYDYGEASPPSGPYESALITALQGTTFRPTQQLNNGGAVVLYIRNLNAASQRIRLIWHVTSSQNQDLMFAVNDYSEPANTAIEPINNTAAGFEQSSPLDPSLYACLQGTFAVSCAGGAVSSGDIELSGNFDVYLNGTRVGIDIPASGIVDVLTRDATLSVDVIGPVGADIIEIVPDYPYYSDPSDRSNFYAPDGMDTTTPRRIWWRLIVDGVMVGIAVGGDIVNAQAILGQWGVQPSRYVEDIPSDRGISTLTGGYGNGSWLQNVDSIPHDIILLPATAYSVPYDLMSDSTNNPSTVIDAPNDQITVTLAPYSGIPHA